MSEVLEKTTVKKKLIPKILPYVNPDAENGGLSKYGMVVHDGVTQKEWLTYLEVNKGVRRYLTGLNEFAPEVQAISDPETKAAIIKGIRTKVQYIEKILGANDVSIDHKDFWNEIKLANPRNYDFWDTIFIAVGNEPVFLDPENPNDLIRICAIEAGGFNLVAKSYEDAKMMATPPKFYLDRVNDTAATKVELKKIKNKATTLLNTLSDKDHKKLFYIVKNIDPNSMSYKFSTSQDVIYDYLDEHINGKGFQRSAKRAAEEFIKVAELKIEDLKVKAIIADATQYRIFQTRGDGLIYHHETNTRLGRNAEEILIYLKDPLNSKVFDSIREDIETKWKE